MKRWKMLVLASGLFISLATAVPARAIDVFPPCAAPGSKVCKAAETDKSATDMVKKIINLLLFVLGITAVLMIVWSGVKYATSRGDPANVKTAKDTLTYAVIGLIVALMAYAIVNFILTSFK